MSGGGFSGMIFNTITLQSVTDNVAVLKINSELENIPGADLNPNMSIEISGTSAGNINLDMKTGLALKSDETKSYKGKMTVNNQGNKMEIPMVIDAQTEIVQQ